MTLYDQFGRELKETKKPGQRDVSVVSIRDRWSQYPSDNLTPVRLAQILKEADQGDVYRQMELFEEMEEKDTHLSAELLKRKNGVNGLDFDVIPFEEGARTSAHRNTKKVEQDKITDFCRDVIFSMPSFEDGLFDLLDAIGKGFSCVWNKWDIANGKAVISDLVWIHQKRLTFADSLTPKLMTDEHPMGEEIGPFETVFHRHKARSGYDTRSGMTRVCAWMYLFKNYAIKDWVAFAEVFGMPLRVGKFDPGASKEDKDALISAIQSLGSDAAGIISKGTEIEFVEAMKGSSKENIYKALADFANNEISKAVIGSTLTTQVGDKGSYAAAKTHNEVRIDLVKSDCRSLADTIRNQILRPLVGYNFGWDVPVPWFRFLLSKSEDLKALMEVYKGASEIGQPIAAEHVSERFGIALPEEGQTLLQPAQFSGLAYAGKEAAGSPNRAVAAPSGVGASQSTRISAKSQSGANPADEDLSAAPILDAIGEKALALADSKDLVDPVRDLLQQCKSLTEFKNRLTEAYAEMDDAELGNLMARALMLANVAGRDLT